MNLREANFFHIERYEYNCGGYALGTFDWYVPYNTDECDYRYTEELVKQAGEEKALDKLANNILADFPELMMVSEDSVKNKLWNFRTYEIIAFRLELKGIYDFHFMKLGKNGSWYEKRGSTDYIHRHAYDYIFQTWNRRYNSKIVFFARERII